MLHKMTMKTNAKVRKRFQCDDKVEMKQFMRALLEICKHYSGGSSENELPPL